MLRSLNKLFNLILIFSALVGSWTSVVLLLNTSFNTEIKSVLNKMYLNQKQFLYNVRDLSRLLVKDANMRFNQMDYDNSNNNFTNQQIKYHSQMKPGKISSFNNQFKIASLENINNEK